MITDDEWEPMSTAPKDRRFLACSPLREVFVMSWNIKFQRFMIDRKDSNPHYQPTLWTEFPGASKTNPLSSTGNNHEEA